MCLRNRGAPRRRWKIIYSPKKNNLECKGLRFYKFRAGAHVAAAFYVAAFNGNEFAGLGILVYT